MKDFFQFIASLFEDVLFLPFYALADLELENWFLANGVNWLFMLIAAVAFGYWMMQLKKFNQNDTEDRSVKAHSFLGKDAQY
ncbi:uracil phosphoribosyltransferase [Mesonia sediminis]|uniref:Uracil phosphoribosyltransferase n=1 Tax=Mesonia sediminis TaxID=1703946 RepID=A0ABW5SF86_9FLAO